MYSYEELKTKSKEALKRNYWKCFLVALILMAVISASTSNSSNLSGNSEPVTVYQSETSDANETPAFRLSFKLPGVLSLGQTFSGIVEDEDGDYYVTSDTEDETDFAVVTVTIGPLVFAVTSVLLGFLLLAAQILLQIFIYNPLSVGCRRFFWKNLDQNADISEMGFAFQKNWTGIGLGVFTTDVINLLFYLLLIIPGIIKSYAYMLVPYLLAEHPDMTGREAREESERLMDGKKFDAFLFGLSFIGWDILSALTLGLVGIFYVNPYKYGAYAAWYETMKKIDAEEWARKNSSGTYNTYSGYVPSEPAPAPSEPAQIPELTAPTEWDRTE